MKTHMRLPKRLLPILLVASFLRLYRIDELMRFIGDEGRDMLAIRHMLVHRDLTLFGPFNETAGRIDFFGVFHYYLMAPALFIAQYDPVGPAVFTALLSVASIYLTFIWLRKTLDQESALLVVLILAVSPLSVTHSQWPWNPNTTNFFGILFLLAVQKWRQQSHIIWTASAGLFLGLLFQLHYFTVALGLAAGLVWLKQDKSWQNRLSTALIFVASFLLPNLTFIAFDLTHEGLYRQILWNSFIGGSNQQLVFFHPWALIIESLEYLLTLSIKFWKSSILGVIFCCVFVKWLSTHIMKIIRLRSDDELSQLAIAWVGTLVIISFFPQIWDDYHSLALWVGLAIAAVEFFLHIQNRPIRWLTFSLLILHLFWQNHLWRAPSWQENMPRIRQVSQAIAQDSISEKNCNVASLVDAETRAMRFRYFITQYGGEYLGVTKYPESQVLYVISPHGSEETLQNQAWELQTYQAAHVSKLWDDGQWKVFKLKKV